MPGKCRQQQLFKEFKYTSKSTNYWVKFLLNACLYAAANSSTRPIVLTSPGKTTSAGDQNPMVPHKTLPLSTNKFQRINTVNNHIGSKSHSNNKPGCCIPSPAKDQR